MRSEIVADWIAQSEFSTYIRKPMTGDASARRYERLIGPNAVSAILMDAPPDTCGSQTKFVEIAQHLRVLDLAAPRVLDWDDALGLMILEDLGQIDFAKHLKTSPSEEPTLYENAAKVLRVLQSAPPPAGLTRMTPNVGADMIDLAFDWAATDQSSELQGTIKSNLHELLGEIDPSPSVLSLRDFHAENLIWRSERTGLSNVGLLDFQDAFVTHPMYDLASLLRDARRDVAPDLLDHLLSGFVQSKGDVDRLKSAFHVLAVQRNLRILGIFYRLAHQSGKSSYLNLVPRVWAHIKTDLTAPICSTLAPMVKSAFAEMDTLS